MVIGESRDLRKMGYTEYLVATGQILELFSDCFRSSPTNAGINFVKNQGALHATVLFPSRRSPASTLAFNASRTRDSSPPEAICSSGSNGSPGLVEIV